MSFSEESAEEFANSFRISVKLESLLLELWIEYRNKLAKELTNHPKYFTTEELEEFSKYTVNMPEDTQKALKQAWFEYKLSYNDPNPSKNLSEEEMDLFIDFAELIGLESDIIKQFITLWPSYKMQLAKLL